ncbi:hypothetical protein [Larkinella soli]|uniref:hypothetical protein n=1 Tax=Larkinella soli TaxID=1770527 RepID=UPI000FFB45E9|nr:hypothetical protein [Larkinella soli]
MKSESERFQEAFDHIMRWYRSDGQKPLSPPLEARRLRWVAAREYIVLYKPLTDSEIVKYLAKTYGISEPQAWRDVRDTKRFFATMEAVDKEFDKIMLIAQIKDLRTKAILLEDYKTAAKCDENLIKLGHFDQPGEGGPAGKTIVLSIDFNPARIGAKPIPNLQQMVEKFIGERARRELMIDDTDFEAVS